MHVYITKLNGMPPGSHPQYAQQMTADIAHQLGFREMGIYRYNGAGESAQSRGSRFDGIIAGLGAGDMVVCQFPTGNGPTFELGLVRQIKAYRGRVVIWLQDPELFMAGKSPDALRAAVEIYNEAEVLIVPSAAAQRFLMDHGVRRPMRYAIWELWDFATSQLFSEMPKFKREFHYLGDPDGHHFPGEWVYALPLKLYTDWNVSGDQIKKMGHLPPDELLRALSQGGFGLIWYGDEIWREALSNAAPLNISAYLAAGLPVIVPRGISCQRLIEENHLGIVVDSLEEALETVETMPEGEYRTLTSAVAGFASLLRDGYFTKKCLMDAIQLSMRKDLHLYAESDEVSLLPPCKFAFVCAKESFGGKVAVSWIFRGEADGYLICDAHTFDVLGEVKGGLTHYHILERAAGERQLVVKAYVRTLRGKLVVAESAATKVEERSQAKSTRVRVSLIMPAYNARDTIVRSIDTALAQSFSDMELIVVNDGSTDGTQDILDWYQGRYPQVKAIYQENVGQAAARNHGVVHAMGDYVSYMDSDDMLRPDMIERLYDTIQKTKSDISISSAYQLTGEGYEEVGAYPLEEDVAIPVEEFFPHYFQYAYSVVWGKLYKKELVRSHPMPSVTYEDSAWIPYILSYAETVSYLNGHLYEYDRTIRSDTYVLSARRKAEEEQYADRRDYILFFLENGNPRRRQMLKKLALGLALGFVHNFSYPKFKDLKEEIEKM